MHTHPEFVPVSPLIFIVFRLVFFAVLEHGLLQLFFYLVILLNLTLDITPFHIT